MLINEFIENAEKALVALKAKDLPPETNVQRNFGGNFTYEPPRHPRGAWVVVDFKNGSVKDEDASIATDRLITCVQQICEVLPNRPPVETVRRIGEIVDACVVDEIETALAGIGYQAVKFPTVDDTPAGAGMSGA